jgi:UDP-N-acetylglucosamine diphosphorylase/glucosamine-1-phosphate N-acetyltransferase
MLENEINQKEEQMPRAIIILGAGKGKRMKSDLPKVLHTINDKPMIQYVIDTVKSIQPDRIIIVVGFKADAVKQTCENQGVEFVLQEEQLGTGHAVLQCREALADFSGTIVVMNGDVPCLRAETIRNFISYHEGEDAAVTVLTAVLDDPAGYGRIVRNGSGALLKITEEKDATAEERKIDEINSGLFCFDKELLFDALDTVGRDNVQGEYYLTDMIEIMRKKGLSLRAFCVRDPREVSGVNTSDELKIVQSFFEVE